MDDLRPRRPGRLVLKALAIASALGFLTLVMVQAMAFYAPPPKPPTKAEPVVPPRPLVQPAEPEDRRLYLPETKAGTFGRYDGVLKIAPAPQQKGTPHPRN
jgi:hypothetical protein